MNYAWLQNNLTQILGLVIVVVAILVAFAAKQKKVGQAGTMVVIVLLAIITVGLASQVGGGWATGIINNILGGA